MSQIRVELQLEDGNFTTGVWRAGRTLAQFKDELKRTNPAFDKLSAAGKGALLSIERTSDGTQTLVRRLRDLSVVGGGVALAFHAISGASNGLIGNVIRVNAEMEKLKYQLAGMSTAAEPMKEAADQVDRIRTMVSSVPFGIGQVTSSFVKMKAAGLDPMNGSLIALLDGMAAFGASDEQVNRVTVALTQMQGKGVLSMEELRQQLGESMPSAMKLMARAMGVSVGELTKMVSTGTVDSKKALDKWFAEVERSYGGAGAEMMKSFTGQLAKIRTELTKLATTGEMKTAFDTLKEMMGGFAGYLGTGAAREFFDTLGTGLQGALEMAKTLTQAFAGFGEMIGRVMTVAPYALGGAALIMSGKAIGGIVQGLSLSYAALTASMLKAKKTALDAFAASALAAQATGNAVRATAATASAAAGTAARQQAATSIGMLAGSATSALGAVAAAGSRLLSFFGPIGMGLAIFGPLVWDIAKGFMGWGDGAEKAAEKTESATQAAIRASQAQYESEIASLDKQIAEKSAANDRYFKSYGTHNDYILAEMANLQKKQEQAKAAHNERMQKLDVDAAAEQVQAIKDKIRESGVEASRAYNKAMIEAEEANDKRIVEQAKSGLSSSEISRLYHADIKKARDAVLSAELGRWNKAIEEATLALNNGTGSTEVVAKLIEGRNDLQARIAESLEETLKIDRVLSPESDEKKFERLGKAVKDAAAEVADLHAELNGASGEVGKLLFQMRRGDFGNLKEATSDVLELHEALIQTTLAAEAMKSLDKMFDDADRELKSIREGLEEENLKLEAKLAGVDTNDNFAFFEWKVKNGKQAGFEGPPAEIAEKIQADLTRGLDLSIRSFDQVKDAIQKEAFGEASMTRIRTVGAALNSVREIAFGLSSAISGIDFSNMANSVTGAFYPGGKGMPNIVKQVDGGILDMIAKPESGGDYNATLDNGKWTNGKQNLTGMTLNEVRQLQEFMLSHPGNRAKYGQGKYRGSSALGRYQIVGDTLQRLMKSMKLTGGELFDEKMQDRMALQLARETGGRPEQLKKVWTGLAPYDNATIAKVYSDSINSSSAANQALTAQGLPTSATDPAVVGAIGQRQDQVRDGLEEARPEYEKNKLLRSKANLNDMERSLAPRIEAHGETPDGETVGSNLLRFLEAKSKGEFELVSPEEIERVRQLAVERDKLDEKAKRDKADQKKLTEDQIEAEAEMANLSRERVEILSKLQNKHAVTTSSEVKSLEDNQRKMLAAAERLYGKDTPKYLEVKNRYDGLIGQQRGVEAAEAAVKLRREAEDAEMGAITNEREARNRAFLERVTELTALRDQAIMDGANVAQAQMDFERAVAAERKRLMQENRSELAAQIEQMNKLGENINASTASWASSLSDNLYSIASGEGGGFKAFGDAVRESLARSLTDKAAASLLKPFEQMLGGDGMPGSGIGGMIEKMLLGDGGISGLSGMFSGITEMLKSMLGGLGGILRGIFGGTGIFGVMHTGGIVGVGGGTSRVASAANFVGAPKYHTGGIVGAPAFRKGLMPSEVPIIAQKGEGIFTPEQMANLGGSVNSQSINISAPVTVNASGGTQEQNADLARQVARESEAMLRGLVQNEMVRQMRPGGLMR